MSDRSGRSSLRENYLMGVVFNGTTQRLEVANEAFFDYERTDSFSVACWIYLPTTWPAVPGPALGKGDAALTRGYVLNAESSQGPTPDWHITNGPGNAIHAFGPDNVTTQWVPAYWIHLAATYDGSSDVSGCKLYIAGKNVATGTGTNPNTNTLTATILNDQPVTAGGLTSVEFSQCSIEQMVVCKYVLTATDVANLANIATLATTPVSYLSAAPALYLPLLTVSDLRDLSGNGNDATAINSPTSQTGPAVEFDFFTTLDFTTSNSFTHTPVNDPRGVVVMIAQDVSSTSLISGVSYGGKKMDRVPTNGYASDPAGEPGASYMFFLGSGIPTGPQTVAVSVSGGSNAKTAYCMTLNAGRDTMIAASGKVEGDTLNPSVTLATGSDFAGTCCSILYSGQNAPASLVPGAGYTALGGGRDFGSQSARAMFGTKSGASVVCDWSASAEDTAMIAAAISQVPVSSIAWTTA